MRAGANAGWVLVAAAALPGCGGCGSPPSYPPDLTFAPRTDRLVLRVPNVQPATTGEPGKLEAETAALDSLGGRTVDPAALPPDRRDELDAYLVNTFGTPAAPKVDGADSEGRLGLTPEALAEGGRLYRRHCLQCHGLNGDGRGPTGPWIYPHPRDFRRGAFKFVTTGDGGKPRRSDLARTIRDGLPGTAMPAFGLIPEHDRDLMAGYVTYLSLRGETEFRTLAALLTADEDGPENGVSLWPFAGEKLAHAVGSWERAGHAPPTPPAPPADEDAVRRGYELFAADAGAGCIKCHEDFGRRPSYRYDVWGTVVRPNGVTAERLKGGRDPEVLYHRVRHGIQPSGMPAHPSLTDRQVWDLVSFVRAAPYPRELPADVRSKVYPGQ
jgi:mono/diheme cytochrome c family protein